MTRVAHPEAKDVWKGDMMLVYKVDGGKVRESKAFEANAVAFSIVIVWMEFGG